MDLQVSVMGNECFWSWSLQTLQLSQPHAVCSMTQTAAPPSWRRSAVVWASVLWVGCSGFFPLLSTSAFFQGKKITDWGFSSCHVAHTLGRFELIYCSLRTLSLRIFSKFFSRSFAAGHHLPERGDNTVGLMSVFLYWNGNYWHRWLSGCLRSVLAKVLRVMPVDISGPKSPAMPYPAQLMPLECKPWNCKIKPILIIWQHLSLPGPPSFLFLSLPNGASLMQLEVALLSC